MFRKKAVSDDSSIDAKSEHKIANFGSISSIFKGNSSDSKDDSIPVVPQEELSTT